MSDKRSDDIGDRIKAYEQPSTSRKAFKGQPMVVRLDGNNFHTFTKGLKRPYDESLSQLMVLTAKALVERFDCDIAYTQSDEITLIFNSNADDNVGILFDGRFQKIETLTASYATAVFNKNLAAYLPQKADLLPCFDSRAYVVPNLQEAYHALLWRQQDAIKNAISMAAQSQYKQSELNGKCGTELLVMLIAKDIYFSEYPYFFQRGTFVRRQKVERMMTPEELEKIPAQYRPRGTVMRSEVVAFDINLKDDHNPVDLLFGSRTARPRHFEYKDSQIEIIRGRYGFEYRITGCFEKNDPTSWNNYESAVAAAQQYIDWFWENHE